MPRSGLRLTLALVLSSWGALAACELCTSGGDIRSAWPSDVPGATVQALALNDPRPVDERVTVRIIRVADDDGSDPAPLFGSSGQQAIIFDLIDAIWAQAGIDVALEIRPGTWNHSFANRGDGAPRPTSDLNAIIAAADAAGVLDPDGLTLNLFMVRVVPGFSQQGDNTANGLARRPGNGMAMWAGPNLPGFTGGREVVASVLAHEIGHNLGLPHIAEAQNLMQPGGSPNQGERLNASQISTSRASSFSRPFTSLLRTIVITLRRNGSAVEGQAVDFANTAGGSTLEATDASGTATASGLGDRVATRITFPPGPVPD